jgi:hypothetical protein
MDNHLVCIISEVEGAKACCIKNMLSRQCLKQQGRLSRDRLYHDRVFVVPQAFQQAGGIALRSVAGQFRWRSHFAEGCRPPLQIDWWSGRMPGRQAGSWRGGSFLARVAGATGVLDRLRFIQTPTGRRGRREIPRQIIYHPCRTRPASSHRLQTTAGDLSRKIVRAFSSAYGCGAAAGTPAGAGISLFTSGSNASVHN